jgi:hypothetical protein
MASADVLTGHSGMSGAGCFFAVLAEVRCKRIPFIIE